MTKIIIFENYEYILGYLIRNKIFVDRIDKISENKTMIYLKKTELKKIPFKYQVIKNNDFKYYKSQIKNNKFLLISIILFLFLTNIVNNMIFKINIIHSNKQIRDIVKEELKNEGIHEFMVKKSSNELDNIKRNILSRNRDKIEWLEISNKGVVYNVKVQERIITKKQKINEKCNIISTKNSFVTRYYLKKGNINVDINDYVKKDDILINGEIILSDDSVKSVCADGDIYGSTWYLIKGKIPVIKEEKQYSKKIKYNLGFNYGSYYNYLFKNHAALYDKKKVKILEIKDLTIYFEIIKPYHTKMIQLTENEAIRSLKQIMKNKLYDKVGVNSKILDEKVLLIKKEKSIIELEIFYNVEEKISKKIIISE